MHSPEKEIYDPAGIPEIFDTAHVLHIALNDEGTPISSRICFARSGDVLYCHSSITGKKLDLIIRDPRAGFKTETEAVVVSGETPCMFGINYRSVIGTGEASLVMDLAEKLLGLDLISKKYADTRRQSTPGGTRHTIR
ncbi:MAG: pyridoxamine 5'-phosphate oxidase family protein [Methanoregulaceae archaeon]|nr:pyridoxamine 5'-phosphate oxidase family protein [Methanoregulaceae archaeon]